jgi:hypothetical protein
MASPNHDLEKGTGSDDIELRSVDETVREPLIAGPESSATVVTAKSPQGGKTQLSAATISQSSLFVFAESMS